MQNVFNEDICAIHVSRTALSEPGGLPKRIIDDITASAQD